MVQANSRFIPKKPGDLILSAEWNAAMQEIERLDIAKLNCQGSNTLQGPLTILEALRIGDNVVDAQMGSNNVGIGTADATEKLRVNGDAIVTGNISTGTLNISNRDNTQRIGITSNTIAASGNSLNQDLSLQAKGTGKVNILSPLEATNISTTNLTITGTGTASIGGTASVGTLKVTGSGESTFAGPVKASGAVSATSLTASGVVSAGSMTVTGATTLASISASSLTASGVVSATSLTVSGSGNASIGGTANVGTLKVTGTGESTFAGSVKVTGAISATSLTATGALSASSLNVSGNAIVSNGRVGISTSSPKSLLEIYQNVSGIGPILTLSNHAGVADVGGAIDFKNYDTETNYQTARICALRGNYSSHLAFFTKQPGNSTNALIERFRVQNDGNVGIGTTTPSQKLHVDGNAIVSGNIKSAKLTVASGDNTQSIDIGSNIISASGSVANQDLTLQAKGTGKVRILSSLESGSISPTNLSVTGTDESSFAGSLKVTGATTLASISASSITITGTGTASIGGTASVGTLKVTGSGESTFAGPLKVTGTVSATSVAATGALSGGSLNVTGATTLASISATSLTASGAVSATSLSITGTGTASIGGTLSAASLKATGTGESTFAGPVKVNDAVSTNSLSVNNNAIVSGNVGIGTTSPNATLHVHGGKAGTAAAAAHFQVENCGAACAQPIWTEALRLRNISQSGRIGLGFITGGSGDLSQVPNIYLGTGENQNNSRNSFRFATNVAGVLTDQMVIDGNGNVGIGTTSPSVKLEVKGGQTKLEQEDWIVPTLQNNWKVDRTVGYFKDSHGIVHFRGSVQDGTVPNAGEGVVIFQLNSGYFPDSYQIQIIVTGPNGSISDVGRIEIKTNGMVYLKVKSSTWACLDGITFRTA